jgi:hypothetical protein
MKKPNVDFWWWVCIITFFIKVQGFQEVCERRLGSIAWGKD